MYRRKVRFSDTDCQGHVFNANYFVYADDAITDFLEELGLIYAEMVSRGHDMVLARAECDFRSAATLGETVEVEVSVIRVGNTSFTLDFVATATGDGRVVARGKEVYVILDRTSGTPTPLPDYVRGALAGPTAASRGG